MMGAHVLRAGVNRQIIDLLERGLLDHIAMNGAGADSRLRTGAHRRHHRKRGALHPHRRIRAVARDRRAQRLDPARPPRQHLGLGENVGRRIALSEYPHRDLSVLAAAWRLSVPVTVHVGIGYDIMHEHPNCDGAALGAASYRDFLIFARTVERLEGGILLSFGSAIMAPEVYLKALAMARNVAHQEGRDIRHFATAVFDLVPIARRHSPGAAQDRSGYYFRPHKTILVRTVADGGESFYFCGDHRATFPALRTRILETDMTTAEILAAIPKLSALVVGDICLDRWCTYDPATSRAFARNRHPAHRGGPHRSDAREPEARWPTTWPRWAAAAWPCWEPSATMASAWNFRARWRRAAFPATCACGRIRHADVHLHQGHQPRQRHRRPAAPGFHQHRRRSTARWNGRFWTTCGMRWMPSTSSLFPTRPKPARAAW